MHGSLLLLLATLSLIGCSPGPERATAPNGYPGAATSSPDGTDPEKVEIGASGPIELPASWKKCSADNECQMVAYGCCTQISANREHAAAVQAAMRRSSRPHCDVKSACGRGRDGTPDGEPAECLRGRCYTPIQLPDDATRCREDDDCVVAMMDCCNKVAVYKSYEKAAVRVMLDLETDRPMCPPSASCMDPPPTCVAGKCQRRAGQ